MQMNIKEYPSLMDRTKMKETKELCAQLLPKKRKFSLSIGPLFLRILKKDCYHYFRLFVVLCGVISIGILLHADAKSILTFHAFLCGLLLCYELFKAYIYHTNELQSCVFINLRKLFVFKSMILMCISIISIVVFTLLITFIYGESFQILLLNSLGAFLCAMAGTIFLNTYTRNSKVCFGAYSVLFLLFLALMMTYQVQITMNISYIMVGEVLICIGAIYYFYKHNTQKGDDIIWN